MNIRVLGCSGAIAAGYQTTAFLLDDDVLLDAGTGVGLLSLEALARIDHICLSHSHLDHILGIPLLADAVLRLRHAAGRPPVQVHALPETLEALRQHVFNGVIWPDFTRLPNATHPVLSLHPYAVGDVIELAGRRIEILSAAHTVPACGFAVQARRGGIGSTPATRAPTRCSGSGSTSCSAALGDRNGVQRRRKGRRSPEPAPVPRRPGHRAGAIANSVDVRITHIKPGEVEAVMAGIGARCRAATASRPCTRAM